MLQHTDGCESIYQEVCNFERRKKTYRMCSFIWPETCLYGHYNEMYFLPTVKGYAYRTVSFSLLTFKAPVLCRSITFSIRWQLMNAVNPKAQFLGEFRESFPLKREVVWIKCRSWIQLARTRHRLVFRIRNIELTRRRKKNRYAYEK